MNMFLVYALLSITLVPGLIPIERGQLSAAQNSQSNCVEQAVQNDEVLAWKQMDINQDKNEDEVVVYGQDDLYALIVVNRPTLGCKIILNDRLTSRQMLSDRRAVKVQQVELVDLTGDNQPELHIWLDLSTPAFRASDALHVIYKLDGESMEKVFVRSQCLDMSSYEFRTAPDGAKLIYLDEDRRCAPPSSRRDYEILRWNANDSQFERVESGEVSKTSPDPLWDALVSIYIVPVVVVIGIVVLGLVAWRASKRKTLEQR